MSGEQMDKPKILIVDDDDDVRMQMKWALAPQYDTSLAEDRLSALEALQRTRPRAVTLDLGLPPSPGDTLEGLLTLDNMLQFDPFLKVLVVTGQDEKEIGIKAIEQGAYDFFAKPVNIDELKIVLDRALHVQQLKREGREMRETADVTSFEGIIGNSSQIHMVCSTIQKVSVTDASVLIVGESGTGKELVARAIHRRSSRKGGPFVTINCGAIPENLLESELFGHEKGSFTGAHVQRRGRIEIAQGGTLFLDEIGDLPVPLQVKLLRFLQEREIERIGGRSPIRVDARVLAATSVDLRKAMSEGRFREDLYYRLGVVVISVPPLRDREGDIQLLAQAILLRHAAPQQKHLVFTPKSVKVMDSYRWPGNVRELENRIQRAAIMAENGRITPEDLEISRNGESNGQGLGRARQELERRMIAAALARNKGNLTQTAAELEISRPTLYELIDRLAIPRQ
jgi:two-component system NtrC family response regulator